MKVILNVFEVHYKMLLRKSGLLKTLVLAFSLFLLCSCASKQVAKRSDYLERIGIDPEILNIQPEQTALFVNTENELAITTLLKQDPLNSTNKVSPIVSSALAVKEDSVSSFLGIAGHLADLHASPDPRLLAVSKPSNILTHKDRIPESLEATINDLLNAAIKADFWIKYSRESIKPWTVSKVRKELASIKDEAKKPSFNEVIDDYKLQQELLNFDRLPLLLATKLIVKAVEEALPELKALAQSELFFDSVSYSTSFGKIVIGGIKDNKYNFKKAPLLLIDFGGDDSYNQAAAVNAGRQSVSISIDLSGNDLYQASENELASFGAGLFGVGVLYDLEGSDIYAAPTYSQAAGFYGSGILYDGGGDDVYVAASHSQSASFQGLSLLIDQAGDDRYESFSKSQSFAGASAVSFLINKTGDDVYLLNDKDIRFPARQNKKHNLSLGQATGAGSRADMFHGLSLPGGVAFLIDGTGDDRYICGVFCQAASFWQGSGILVDSAGNDRYLAHWYGQGASTHFGFAGLYEGSGNDKYLVRERMGLGAGHDLAVGTLMDFNGNDFYHAPPLSLGASNDSGLGIFLDENGDDHYIASASESLGWANQSSPTSLRAGLNAYGVFLDPSGRDKFESRENQPWQAPDSTKRLSHSKFELN